MTKLGDLKVHLIVEQLLTEVRAASERAEPGTTNFHHEMVVVRILTSLAIALNKAHLEAIQNETP